MNKLRVKIILESTITKIIAIVILVVVLLLAIILPSVIATINRPEDALTAFNRDATSGTREAFVSKVLNSKEDEFTPGDNVLEVTNNESMIRAVSRNADTVGYVSFGTIATFDENGKAVLKDGAAKNINFASMYNSKQNTPIRPDKENIKNGDYTGQRYFNIFLRVDKESKDHLITEYDFNTNTINQDVSSLSDNLKASYFFYNWLIHSSEAHDFIETETGELPFASTSVDFEILNNKDYIDEYINQTKLTSNQLKLQIVGSTSASTLITELGDIFENDINTLYGANTVDVILATNGSGDAFKREVPGVDNSYIGLQSRQPKEQELNSWGYDVISNDVYNAFAIDAILVIYNDSKWKDNYYFTSESLEKLYTSNEYVVWDEVFTQEGGGA